MPRGSTPKIGIVGAGLTGLTAAWRLRARGFDVSIFERNDHAGGRTRSIRQDGFIFDVGAITLLPTYARTCALSEELGISDHLHLVSPVIGIPRNGKIHRLDLARPVASLLKTRLISTATKLRLLALAGPLLKTWSLSNFKSLAPLAPWDGETIADRVFRSCGQEALEYVAGPVIRGNTLNSTASAPFGELLWMLRQYAAPHLFGFDQGINFLAETLASRLQVTYRAEVTGVEPQADGVVIRTSQGAAETFDACVLALPPAQMLALAPTLTTTQEAVLSAIKPLPSVSLHVGLKRRPKATETFILPPESEHPRLTTIVLDHLKAPGRAPEGKGVMSFFLSDTWSAANAQTPDEAVKAAILAMAQPFVGDLADDIESWAVQRWPYAIIKSEAGLYRQIAAYEADLDPTSNIQLAGDFLSMGMEAAVIAGEGAASNLITRFQDPSGPPHAAVPERSSTPSRRKTP